VPQEFFSVRITHFVAAPSVSIHIRKIPKFPVRSASSSIGFQFDRQLQIPFRWTNNIYSASKNIQ